MSIVDERLAWRVSYEEGDRPDVFWLDRYADFRLSELDRLGKSIEQLCEYILYLEDKLRRDFDSLPALCASCGDENYLHSLQKLMECAAPQTITQQILKEWDKC